MKAKGYCCYLWPPTTTNWLRRQKSSPANPRPNSNCNSGGHGELGRASAVPRGRKVFNALGQEFVIVGNSEGTFDILRVFHGLRREAHLFGAFAAFRCSYGFVGHPASYWSTWHPRPMPK